MDGPGGGRGGGGERADRVRSGWLGGARRALAGLVDRSSAPARSANRTDRADGRGDLRVAAVAVHGPADRRAARIGRARRSSRILKRDGMGTPGPAGPGAGAALRARAARRADPHRRQEAWAHPGRRRQARHGRLRKHYQPTRTDRDGRRRLTVGWEFVHIAIDDATRLAYAEVLRRRESHHRDRVPAPRGRLLRQLRHHRPAAAHRQRLGLPLSRPRDRLPRAGHPPPPHPPPPPTDQRQGRTLHPHPPGRLGLRRDLPLQHPTHRSPCGVPPLERTRLIRSLLFRLDLLSGICEPRSGEARTVVAESAVLVVGGREVAERGVAAAFGCRRPRCTRRPRTSARGGSARSGGGRAPS